MAKVVETVLEPVVGIADTSVIVRRSTEGIKFRTVALADDGLVAIAESGQ